jgi:hypothetical protein
MKHFLFVTVSPELVAEVAQLTNEAAGRIKARRAVETGNYSQEDTSA